MRLMTGFAIVMFGCSLIFASELDGKKLKGTPSFVLGKNLMCTISQASDERDIGKKLSFVDLQGEFPKVLFEDSSTSPLKKVFESPETLSLILVASGTGGIDAFVIDKKSGKFSRAVAGTFLQPSATASLGVCH